GRRIAGYIRAWRGGGGMMRRLDTAAAGFEAAFNRLITQDVQTQSAIDERVAAIIEDVRIRGDQALLEYTRDLDAHALGCAVALEVPASRLQAALNGLDATA